MKTNNLEQENFTGSRNPLWQNPKSRFQIDNVDKSLRLGKKPVLSCASSIIIMLLNTAAYAHILEHTKSELDLHDEGEVTRYNGVASYTLPEHLTFSGGKYSQDWHFFDMVASDIPIDLTGSIEHIRSEHEVVLNNKGKIIRYNSVTTYALPKDWFFSGGKYSQNLRFFDVTSSETEVSFQGSVWVIGQNHDSAPGEPPIKTFGPSNPSWQPVDRAAARIAVDSDGTPWVVSKSGKVYKFSGTTWEKIDANPITSDIATGKDGSVWRTTQDSVDKWINDNARWQNYSVPGIATRIAIDTDGNPWIINSEKKIYRLNGSNWEKMPGRAIDIGSSGNRVWVTGDDKVIYFWDENDNDWEKAKQKKPSNPGWWTAVTGKAVSVDYTYPWIIDQNPHGVDFWSTQSDPIG